MDTQVYLESCQTSKIKEPPAKTIIAWNYFPKTLQYVLQRSKYRRTFEYVRVLNMPGIEVLNMRKYALESKITLQVT